VLEADHSQIFVDRVPAFGAILATVKHRPDQGESATLHKASHQTGVKTPLPQ
jgi:hypothetical protein